MKFQLAIYLIAILFLPMVLNAQESDESGYDRVWSLAQLYAGDDDSFFQSFDLSGRLQLDLAYADSGDDSHSEFNVRRFRFGFKTRFKQKFILHIEGEFDPQDLDEFYSRLTDTYLAWSHSKAATITLGKHSAGFTLDGMTSSKNLLAIDRSNLTNNIWFTEEYIPGVSFKGKAGNWQYFGGVFSSGDKDPEFGDFKGGEFVLLTLGHDFSSRLNSDEALLRLNLVKNEPDPDNGFTNLLENILSLNFQYEKNNWGIRTDIAAGSGYYGQSDLWGFTVMPYYRFNESTEVVTRYTYIDSKEDNGIRFARYERFLAEGMGDRYNEIYLGLNYYWYGHKLKLQNGIQYLDMRDQANDGGGYSGWSWTTGFRISW
jgi:phosphate-selective porin OprO/OprP